MYFERPTAVRGNTYVSDVTDYKKFFGVNPPTPEDAVGRYAKAAGIV